jgi:signal transduction histidine kinase
MRGVCIAILILSSIGAVSDVSDVSAQDRRIFKETGLQMQRDYIARLKKEAAEKPDDLDVELSLGRALYSVALHRDWAAVQESEKVFADVLIRYPGNAIALAYHGSVLGLKIGYKFTPEDLTTELGRRSVVELDRAVALAPESVEVRYLRAYSSFYSPSYLGRDMIAVEDFKRIIELLGSDPNEAEEVAEAYVSLGDTWNKIGNSGEALASWSTASRLLPGSAIAAEADSRVTSMSDHAVQESSTLAVGAFLGFLLGSAIFGILLTRILKDLIIYKRSRSSAMPSFFVTLAAFLWNAANLAMVPLYLGHSDSTGATEWFGHNSFLVIASLLPIPLGLIAAYRFYKATFMDIALKRGAALLVLLALSFLWIRVWGVLSTIGLTTRHQALRPVIFTCLWLLVFAIYLPIRHELYSLVDRFIFRRRDYSDLISAINRQLSAVTDQELLKSVATQALKDGFTAESARFLDASDSWFSALVMEFSCHNRPVILRQQIAADELHSELKRNKVEALVGIKSKDELLGVIVLGGRMFGQGYMSEDLTILTALAGQVGRTMENVKLHESRRRQETREEELRKLASQAELTALRAQIDPHFFFNALNSIAALINDDPRAAEELVENLAELFRYAFRRDGDFITLGQELELVDTYLYVEKVRLGERLRVQTDLCPEAMRLMIPALSIQPLVENAVKHGIAAAGNGGSVSVSAKVDDGNLKISVQDSGKGISPGDFGGVLTKGVGLGNVNSRLMALYGTGLDITSAPGLGTTVSYTISIDKLASEAVACKR